MIAIPTDSRLPQPALRTAILALAALGLGACDVRQDGAAEPDPTASPVTAQPSPADTASPAASIMRDDLDEGEAMDLPTQPVALTIPFPNGADLSPAAERMLAGILQEDAMGEPWPVVLQGHTDSGGNDQANLRASRARAEAVAAWLVERGVADDRIEVVAFGEQNPIAPNALPDGSANEEGRRRNRRVELRIAPPAAPASTAADETAGADAAATGAAVTGTPPAPPRRPAAPDNET
ncbi:OmpA family protein [Erythrobacter arachoides]|uniref:OmpA family protein n=1 Tax=Aurantiacibacter arachoides TaxID=1850444 RepID=A0A845A739_9SPHN|nr:OmpA family protein [Aurantiacibacter arachoides]MXO94737.1 OmpA family protein [Aurantiacibacter arachoides]GGD61036.1 hypothetical protein GCM10011411_21620 [Aurantiacibacter arachoides]